MKVGHAARYKTVPSATSGITMPKYSSCHQKDIDIPTPKRSKFVDGRELGYKVSNSYIARLRSTRAALCWKTLKIISTRFHQFPGTPSAGHVHLIHLPDDIVGEIFKFYLQATTLDDNSTQSQTPFFLSSICHAWSRIVRSTPSLWTNIHLHLRPHKYDIQLNLLARWLQRTSGCLLALEMKTFLEDAEHWEMNLPSEIYLAIETRAPQIHALSLHFFPDPILREFDRFSNLVSLRVANGQGLPLEPQFCALKFQAPKLTRLETFRINTDRIRITDEWNNVLGPNAIRHLATFGVPSSKFISMFKQPLQPQDPMFAYAQWGGVGVQMNLPSKPQLTHLYYKNGMHWGDAEDLNVTVAKVSLPHLKYFQCELNWTQGVFDVFRHIGQAANLTSLIIVTAASEDCRSSPYNFSQISLFIEHAGCQLEVLRIASGAGMLVGEDVLMRLLSKQQKLRSLHIQGAQPAPDNLNISSVFISSLRSLSTSQLVTLGAQPNLLPNLTSFYYHGATHPNFSAKELLNMLAQRRYFSHMPWALKSFAVISTTGIYDIGEDCVLAVKELLCEETPDLNLVIKTQLRHHQPPL